MGSQWTFSRASFTETSLIMLSLVGLFSDPNLGVYLGANEVPGVYTDKSRICLSSNLSWMDTDLHA